MRTLAVLITSGMALAGGAGGLAGQHAGQFEVGGFGAYTRYAAAFGLPNRPGGGARLGYLVGDAVGVEGEIVFQPEYTVSPSGTPITLQPLIASGSLVFNILHASRLMVYVLGGYSLLDFGTRTPYHFTDNAAHGGAGVRLFLSERIALRLDGRALYSPKTQSTFGPTTATHYVATAGLSVFHLGGARPAAVPPPPPAPPVPPPPVASLPEPQPAKCPTPPPGTPVDSLGCALAVAAVPPAPAPPPAEPAKCPTPAPGTPVDSLGCALPVAEAVKPAAPAPAPAKCPPAPPGSPVDANGCLILFAPQPPRPAAPGAPPRPTLILRGVTFETGKSALTRDSYVVLDAVAGSLLANPDIRIEIAGYTDNTGRRYLNLRLSQARAAAVRAYLARKGVSPARMVAKGYGASGFIAPNTTIEGRAQNRRVELHKLP